MGMMEIRNRILKSAPHLVHASKNDSFDIMVAEPKISGMKVYVEPYQEGSGTPSVTNQRPIHGTISFSTSFGNKTITKNFNSSYIKGVYDCDTGYFDAEWTIQSNYGDSSITSYVDRGTYSTFWAYVGGLKVYDANNLNVVLLSNMFTWTGYHYKYGDVPDWSFAGASAYPNSFWMRVPNSALPELSLNGAKAFLAENPLKVAGPRSAGIGHWDQGTLAITADRGLQHVSILNNPGNLTAEFDYWTH